MVITKSYMELDYTEKNQVLEFKQASGESVSIDQLDDMFIKKITGYGEGVIFAFYDKQVCGKIEIVLESCKELGNIYIYSTEIVQDKYCRKEIVKSLIDKAIIVSKKHNPNAIFLSVSGELLNICEDLGYRHQYTSATMRLEEKSTTGSNLVLQSLNNDNKELYHEIINKSFSDMPHGIYHYLIDIEKYMTMADENNYFFIVEKDKTPIGFMNIEILENKGLFDIGICKEFRGKGYGKKLLETAIDFLNKKAVENIELIVIKKNHIAYEMYKKRGFKERSIIGYWLKL